uniref:Probable pectate lyase F n=1 Tax=Meloidogyne hapla TaxID=6305 RepID=A0A1I8BNN1_MELHA
MPQIISAFNHDGAKFCEFPTPSKTITTSKTFFINNHTDFKMQRIIFNGQKGTCNPNIPKQWDSVIIIEDGGSISNVILGESPEGTAADVNCIGSCNLTNVWWEKACWRAASFRATDEYNRLHANRDGDKKEYSYIVDGGGALDGFQKIFDQSGPGKTIIKNFCTANSSIVLRTCGNCGHQYTRHVAVKHSKFMGPGLTIIGANTEFDDKVSFEDVSIYGYNNPKTKISFACTEASGEDAKFTGYEPGKPGSGKTCTYKAEAVKVID